MSINVFKRLSTIETFITNLRCGTIQNSWINRSEYRYLQERVKKLENKVDNDKGLLDYESVHSVMMLAEENRILIEKVNCLADFLKIELVKVYPKWEAKKKK